MYDNKPAKTDPLATVPDPPSLCLAHGCHNKTDVLFLQVRRGDNMLTGAASDFCVDREKTKGRPILKSEYIFYAWVSRCGGCYVRELRGANKHQMRGLDEKRYQGKAA